MVKKPSEEVLKAHNDAEVIITCLWIRKESISSISLQSLLMSS